MSRIFALLAGVLADRVAREVKAGVSPLAPYLRRLAVGVVIILISTGAWFSGLLFLLLTLFLYASDQAQYAAASLWTAAISFLIGIVLALYGMGLVRKPR